MTSRTWVLLLILALGAPAFAETIAVIGTGNVGMALGTEFAQQGHTIIYGSRSPLGLKALDLAKKTRGNASTATPFEAAAAAEIVVLAVPGMVVEDVVKGLGSLKGKIVIDATNPLLMDEPMVFRYGVATSNGEIVQAAAPDAFVVKAFNTIGWPSMISPEDSDGPLYVPIVGNNQAAKDKVAKMVVAMGLVPFDLGPIEVAHWTEYAAVVSLNNEFSDRQKFDLVFRATD
ncbi:MAG: NAD(P)-binding domain-containing protein [Gammaproteobacteria bacterium]|nr:NAD(P)-binding domain-containing protein [Gammaproteobacteria bacterium]